MYWLNENSRTFLSRGYINDGKSAEDRIEEIAKVAEEYLGIDGYAEKFYEYMSKGFYSLSSPVWSNYGNSRGMPISCFGSHLDDSMPSILQAQAEVGMMSKYGGGTSGYFGDLRHRGAAITGNGHSSGAVHFMKLFEAIIDVVSQGSTRRGRFAPYLPVEHPDIMEFLNIGTEGDPIQELTHGVTVTNKWMDEMIAGDNDKRVIWARILQRRTEIGYPYIFFKDNVNDGKPRIYKDLGLDITHSNLCSEIALPNHKDWSFVCNLSSMNIAKYDEWKDTDAVEIMIYFLDSVMNDYITKLEKLRDSSDSDERQSFKYMERAYNFAIENRALGLGALGWHSYLQEKMIPFESTEADLLNIEIFSTIEERAIDASIELGKMFGNAPIFAYYDEPKTGKKDAARRNATLTAVAPTTSSAFILGQVSQSIEPIWSNIYVKDLQKMKVTIKNPKLEELLEEKGMNTREIWNDIRDHDGSVQHLDFLNETEKGVFKTFQEISPYNIIEQAADRQVFIDQSQSLNLMISPSTTTKDLNALHIRAWELGVKSLYYQHSTNAAQQFSQEKVCISCEA